jgi:hypothetical protein
MQTVCRVRQLLRVIAAISLAAPCARAQSPVSHPDFTGVWVMDTTKFQNNDPILLALKLTVSMRGDTLRIETAATDLRGDSTVSLTGRADYGLDGKPFQGTMGAGNAVMTRTLSWDGTTLVLSTSGNINGRSLESTERLRLDAAGKTMTRDYVGTVNGRTQSQTLVFTRQ